MATTDAKVIAVKGVAYRLYFPIFDNTGAPISAATGLAAVKSLDGAATAVTTNAPTEITGTGCYYIDLTAAEMTADFVLVKVTTTSTNGLTTLALIYTAARNINDLSYPLTTGRGTLVNTSGQVGPDFANAGGTLGSGNFAANFLTSTGLDATAATEVSQAVWGQLVTELSSVPNFTSGTTLQALTWLFMLARNRRIQTSALETLYKDDNTTAVATSAKNDDGSTFTRAKYS